MKFKEEVRDRLNSMDKTLSSQHEILKDHIRRTEALEKIISPSRIISAMAAIAAIMEALHRVMK